jgi:hypothetical protein
MVQATGDNGQWHERANAYRVLTWVKTRTPAESAQFNRLP